MQQEGVYIMQTMIEGIEVVDRNGNGAETRVLSIRTANGELKSHLLKRLLRDREVVKVPRRLVWELVENIREMAIICDEPSFSEPRLAGELAYLADHPEAQPGPGSLRRLLERREELKKKLADSGVQMNSAKTVAEPTERPRWLRE